MADKYKAIAEGRHICRLAIDLGRAEAFALPFILASMSARLAEIDMTFEEAIMRGVYAKAKIRASLDDMLNCFEGSNVTSVNWQEQVTFVLDHGGDYLSEVDRSDMELFSIRNGLDVHQMAKVETLVNRIYHAWNEMEDRADEEREAAAKAEADREGADAPTSSGKRRGRRPKQMKLAI